MRVVNLLRKIVVWSVLVGAALGALYWLLITAVGVYVFEIGSFKSLLFPATGFDLLRRSVGVLLIFLLALVATRNIVQARKSRAELSLRANLLDNAGDGIVLHDHSGRILYANASSVHLLGYPQADLRTMDFFSLALGNNGDQVATRIRELKENETVTFNALYRHANHSVIPAEVRVRAVSSEGRLLLLSAVRDMTDRAAATRLEAQLNDFQRTMKHMVHAITRIVAARDQYTANHQEHVAKLAAAIAEEMALSEDQVMGVRMAGLIHDLGKVRVPMDILNSPRTLTPSEFSIIKEHVQTAYDVLKDVPFPWPIAEMVYEHHEKLNGSGYPCGRRDIRIEARILGVADVVDAMISHRPYRPALGIERAVEEITSRKGTLYDPDVVQACLRVLGKDASPVPEWMASTPGSRPK